VSGEHPGGHPIHYLAETLRSGAFARAYTLTALGAVISGFAIEHVAGLVTYATIVTGLCVVGLVVLIARRHELSLVRLAPTTLVAFIVWAGLSTIWTTSTTRTVLSWVALLGVALIGVVIAHIRDTLQTARALADVMRWIMSISLGLEIVIGIFMRHPIHFLGIAGNITSFGPVQGIFGTRNLLGFAAVLALVTFVIEWRTNSVRPAVSVYSVLVAGALAVLSNSPTVLVLAAAVGLATAALMLVRHAKPHNRTTLQWVLGAIVAIGLIVAYVLRHPIVARLGADTDFGIRTRLWTHLALYIESQPLMGWGWFGPWALDRAPFIGINYELDDHYTSALNAYIDILLQLGVIGLLIFLALVGIALVRSWLVASSRRAVVYAWTPLMLVALLADSLFESFSLAGFGWLLLVVCAVRAGQSRSWRERIDAIDAAPDLPQSERL
jgi:exopolysaccharide production protein ExoQ